MRLPRRRRDDRGFTLIELMVTITLLGIVLTILTSMTITALRSSTAVGVRAQNVNTVRASMDRTTRDLRQAVRMNVDTSSPFTAASSNAVTFVTNIDTIGNGQTQVTAGPTTVALTVGTDPKICPAPDSCLLERDTSTKLGTDSKGATAWVAGSVTTTKALLHHIVAGPKPLFSYFTTVITSSGNPAAPFRNVQSIPVDASGNVAVASYPSIDTVDIYMSVQDPSAPSAPPTSVEQRVSMPDTSSYAVVSPTQ